MSSESHVKGFVDEDKESGNHLKLIDFCIEEGGLSLDEWIVSNTTFFIVKLFPNNIPKNTTVPYPTPPS